MKIFTLILLFGSLSISASDGVILFTKGKVFVDGKIAKKKTKVSYGQSVKAASGSLAVLSMDYGSKLKISENTVIKLSKPKMNKKKTLHFVRLIRGSIFVKYKNKDKQNQRLYIKAKSVSMGVRGTEFFASFGKKGNSDVWMCVNEGSVAVKGKKDKRSVLVKAGEGIVARDDSKTSRPKPLPWTKKLNWNMDPSSGNLKNEVNIEDAYADPLDIEYD